LIDGLTAVVVQLLGAKPEQVRVVIREVRSGGYGVAGRAVYLSPSEPIQARPEP
jgi:4-oxalocrotonate tautomerase family enzyme